jgi:hypothetical protein
MNYLFSTFVLVCLVAVLSVSASGVETTGGDQPNKDASLKLVAIPEQTTDGVSVRLLLENTGKDKVSVLKEFDPLGAFFTFKLVSNGEITLDSLRPAKVSFGVDPPPAKVTLKPGEFVGVSVRLKDVFHHLKKGDYQLEVTYHNQYGDGCFQGKLVSQPVNIKIGDG